MFAPKSEVRRRGCALPVPAGPWQWAQGWSDLLFMHWQVPARLLRPHVPAGLDLDIWDGSPWVSLVAFRLDQVRHSRLPSLGLVANIIELNLRAYVRRQGEPAIYFLSIHADRRLAVALAQVLTPLPYVRARMLYERDCTGYRFQSTRLAAPAVPLHLEACFSPHSVAFEAPAGSQAEWLLERYGLYAVTPRGNLLRTVVQHPPWQVKDVSLRLSTNTIGNPFNLPLSRAPDAAHFSPGVRAFVWPFEKVAGAE